MINKVIKISVLISATILAIVSLKLNAQQSTLSFVDQTDVINNLKKTLTAHYIYLDKAQKVNMLLDEITNSKKLAHISDRENFTKALTEEIQSVIKDKHFRVIVPRQNNEDNTTTLFDRHLNALKQFRKGGFQDIKMLDGNVGYVKIDGFRGEEQHQVDGLMTYLRTADAIIIDLSDNGGGGRPVNYLSSYFLPEDALIGKTFHRNTNTWTELRSESIKGDRRLALPLFIIMSNFTFSAAEAFAYNLQALGRATIVGETSGGGAHPTKFFPLTKGVAALVPNRRSYNSITKSNWEGTGVIPDIAVQNEAVLKKTHELAKQAAKKYREELFENLNTLLSSKNYSNQLQTEVTEVIQEILHRKHIENFMIAGFANEYQQQENPIAAKLLFLANIAIHPNSAMAHFQYGQSLIETEERATARKHIAMAIDIATRRGEDATSFRKQYDLIAD